MAPSVSASFFCLVVGWQKSMGDASRIQCFWFLLTPGFSLECTSSQLISVQNLIHFNLIPLDQMVQITNINILSVQWGIDGWYQPGLVHCMRWTCGFSEVHEWTPEGYLLFSMFFEKKQWFMLCYTGIVKWLCDNCSCEDCIFNQ